MTKIRRMFSLNESELKWLEKKACEQETSQAQILRNLIRGNFK